MNTFQAIILGIVQGITEFLPVSSSGHLVFTQHLFQLEESMVAFDIILHWATALAVLIYFRQDISRLITESWLFLKASVAKRKSSAELAGDYPYAILAALILVGTIPTVIIGFFFRNIFESLFEMLIAVGITWIIMGLILVMSRKFQGGKRLLTVMKPRDALLVGVAQGFAIIPGISRSGSTIITGMICGIEKKDAARFSFLLGIPAIFAAGILKMKEGIVFLDVYPQALAAGFIAAFVSGYLSIAFLMKIIRGGRFYLFGYYCIFAGICAISTHLAGF